MKRKRWGAFLLAALCACTVLPARAETQYGDDDWHVEFTPDEKMVSTFKSSDLDDVIRGLQPGDNIIIHLSLQNKHDEDTNWYMSNEVLHSLEDERSGNGAYAETAGGAYTYILKYINPEGEETELFNSDTVGGDDVSEAGEGLNEATSSLEEFFFLDTLKKGESGAIYLEVKLDGETQGNAYQDTLADLQMNFAVELATGRTEVRQRLSNREVQTTTVRTGDESMPLLYIVIMAVSGVVLLIAAIYVWKRSRRERAAQSRGNRKGGGA